MSRKSSDKENPVTKTSRNNILKQPLLDVPVNLRLRSRSISNFPARLAVPVVGYPENSSTAIRKGKRAAPRSANWDIQGKDVFNFDLKTVAYHDDKRGSCQCDFPTRSQMPVLEKSNARRKTKIPMRLSSDTGTSDRKINTRRSERVAEKRAHDNKPNGKIIIDRSTAVTESLEYIEDIVANMKVEERKILLEFNFMQRYNQSPAHRMSTIKWIFMLQPQIKFSDAEFLLAVNLMDQVLARKQVSTENYNFMMLCIIWIVNKLIGTHGISPSYLIRFCDKNCEFKYLVYWEREILRVLDFKIHMVEPTILANYYLKRFNLYQIKVARDAVRYAIKNFTLCSDYSSYPCSLIAMAALRVTVSLHFRPFGETLDLFFQGTLSPEDIQVKTRLEAEMRQYLL